jgi:Raf kinase inhibitor-like YbhB/YbcL family protein
MTDSPQRRPLPFDYHPPVPSFTVTSATVSHGGELPDAHVAEGGAVSPQLSWSGYPEGTQSFAVTCYDPDAPTGSGFWHWVVFDIPASVTELVEGAGSGDFSTLPPGAKQARSDYGSIGFGGAAPPPGDGPHRYVFTVYAVDVPSLGLDESATPAYVGFNLRFHAIARGNLIAEYENKG